MNNNIDFSYTLSKAHLTRQIDQIKLKIINFWQKIYRKWFQSNLQKDLSLTPACHMEI